MNTTGTIDTASLLRSQFHTLDSIGTGDSIGAGDSVGAGDPVGAGRLCDADVHRRLLLLEAETWSAWSDFRRGGPLPAHPPAPVMLRRMAAAAYRLAALAERQAAASR